MVLVDDAFVAPDERFTLIDVAPSVLGLLGRPIPEAMKGRALFQKHLPKRAYS
jgi:bisphosphoglycerate-independent phosphoglycerate mutase (AlkP superfamily)